jgi:hypothetical protein
VRALFEQVVDLLFAHAAWQRREQEFAGLFFVFGPLGY